MNLSRLSILTFLIALSLSAANPGSPSSATANSGEKREAAEAPLSPAERRYWDALKLMQGNDEESRKKGIQLLKKLSQEEFTEAQVMLGDCYLSGWPGLKASNRKAVAQFRLAAERGNGYAMVSYAQALESGTGTGKDAGKAKIWAEKALATPGAFNHLQPPGVFFAASDDAPALAGSIQNDKEKQAVAAAHYVLSLVYRGEKNLKAAHEHAVQAAEAGGSLAGNANAAIQAAMDFAFGYGVPANQAEANRMLELSKKLRKRSSQQLIHNIASLKYLDEFAVGETEEETSKEVDTESSNLQASIAITYLDRNQKTYNPVEAEKWLKLAAEGGNPSVTLDLAIHYGKGDFGKVDLETAYKLLEKVGSKLYLAEANRAIALLNGLGTGKDSEAAATLFNKLKNADIICYLGSIGKAPATFMSFSEEAELNRKWAEELQDPQAQALLGLRYLYGAGVNRDVEKAAKWFKKSAKKGNPLGLYHYAGYQISKGLEEKHSDFGHEIAMLKKAADQGLAAASLQYGYYQAEGRITQGDEGEAKRYYEQALRQDPQLDMARNNLAAQHYNKARTLLFSGKRQAGLAELQSAVDEWQKLKNLPIAQRNLGDVYCSLVEDVRAKYWQKDDAKAYELYTTAAEGGDGFAHERLGNMHFYGVGVPRTPSEAAYHYRLAALDDNPGSMKMLVYMYINGIGVSKDLDRAKLWAENLANHNNLDGFVSAGEIALLRKDYKNAFDIFEFIREQSNFRYWGVASYFLHVCYKNGYGVGRNKAEANDHLKFALDCFESRALVMMAKQSLEAGDANAAIGYFNKALDTNEGRVGSAKLILSGRVPEFPVTKALERLRKAAFENDTEALFQLGLATYNKLPGAPGFDEAIADAEQAALQGHPKADALRAALEAQRDGRPFEALKDL